MTDLPILSMLRTRMNWHQERQKVLSENVANSDTPGFRPRDLVPPKFDDPAPVNITLARTAGLHQAGIESGDSRFRSERPGGYETRPTGNAVSLEDEMIKVASNQMDYQTATSLYSKSLGLVKTALGKK